MAIFIVCVKKTSRSTHVKSALEKKKKLTTMKTRRFSMRLDLTLLLPFVAKSCKSYHYEFLGGLRFENYTISPPNLSLMGQLTTDKKFKNYWKPTDTPSDTPLDTQLHTHTHPQSHTD